MCSTRFLECILCIRELERVVHILTPYLRHTLNSPTLHQIVGKCFTRVLECLLQSRVLECILYIRTPDAVSHA